MLLKQNGSSFCPGFNTRWALKYCGGGKRQQLLEKREQMGEENLKGGILVCYEEGEKRIQKA